MKHNTKRRILVVDDNPNFLNSFKRIFKKLKYDLYFCTDPIQALNVIKETELDYIISDEQMPYMNGTQLLAKAKAIQPNAQRILITGLPNLATSVAAINTSAVSGFLIKPFNASKLVALLDNLGISNSEEEEGKSPYILEEDVNKIDDEDINEE